MIRAEGRMTVEDVTHPYESTEKIYFHCEYDPDSPEDRKFSRATPSGNMMLQISNPALLEQFARGQKFRIKLEQI